MKEREGKRGENKRDKKRREEGERAGREERCFS